MHGISSYAGGFPSVLDTKDLKDEVDAGFIGYVVGMIFFAVLGSFIQLKYVTEENDQDSDDFMNKDNA